MMVSMTLLSDAVFGNGLSIPGGEDISVLCDEQGFPYYKGNTFKGIFRDEYENYLLLKGGKPSEVKDKIDRLFGAKGDHEDKDGKLLFSDFTLRETVRELVLAQRISKEQVLEACTYLRVQTAVDAQGQAQEGSLRCCRCIKKGMSFYSKISISAFAASTGCGKEETENIKEEIKDVLRMVKWIGTGRTRGLGRVKFVAGEV